MNYYNDNNANFGKDVEKQKSNILWTVDLYNQYRNEYNIN